MNHREQMKAERDYLSEIRSQTPAVEDRTFQRDGVVQLYNQVTRNMLMRLVFMDL